MIPRFHAAFALLGSAITVLAIAWGFYLVGSPATRQAQRFDEQRLRDLKTIAREIQGLVIDADHKETLKEALPKTLEEAAKRAREHQVPLSDPETGEPYVYTLKSDSTYVLCATFALPREWDSLVFWNHPAGKHCFTINVLDPPPFY